LSDRKESDLYWVTELGTSSPKWIEKNLFLLLLIFWHLLCFVPREQHAACHWAVKNRFVTWLPGLQRPPGASARGLLRFCTCCL